MYKKIFKEIKKYNTIVLARHIGPDPDALGSQYALKEMILDLFPNKDVRVVGVRPNKFAFMGYNDKTDDIDKSESLLIVLDTPDIRRVDGANPTDFKQVIKIDHHPVIDDFGGLEFHDMEKSSVAEIIYDLVKNTKFKLTRKIAEYIFLGIVADTNRFMFDYTTPNTFKIVSNLMEEFDIDINDLYSKIYSRPLKELKFFGFLIEKMKITKNGLGYVKIKKEDLDEYGVDIAIPGNLISEFNFIDEIKVWITLTEDSLYKNIRCSIRSKGPVVNKVAEQFKGGGHKLAAGARPKDWKEAEELIDKLDELLK